MLLQQVQGHLEPRSDSRSRLLRGRERSRQLAVETQLDSHVRRREPTEQFALTGSGRC